MLRQELGAVGDRISRGVVDGISGRVKPPASPMGSLSPSPEFERAREEVERQLSALEARQKAWAASARGAKADPGAEVQRLLAEIEAKQAAWKAPARPGVSVSSR